MNRRGFLRALGVGGSAAVALAMAGVDPEWRPGQRTHFLPPTHGWSGSFQIGDVFTISGKWAINPVTGLAMVGHLQQFVVTGAFNSGITMNPYYDPPPQRASMRPLWAPPVERRRR